MASKATICRLKNVSKRLLKTKYKHLSPIEKTYIKLIEKKQQTEKELNSFWRYVKRDEHGRASQDNDWEFYHWLNGEMSIVCNKIERFLKRNKWTKETETKVLDFHLQCNLSPGGSY